MPFSNYSQYPVVSRNSANGIKNLSVLCSMQYIIKNKDY